MELWEAGWIVVLATELLLGVSLLRGCSWGCILDKCICLHLSFTLCLLVHDKSNYSKPDPSCHAVSGFNLSNMSWNFWTVSQDKLRVLVVMSQQQGKVNETAWRGICCYSVDMVALMPPFQITESISNNVFNATWISIKHICYYFD